MLIEFEVHFECNAALFSLTMSVITPVWRDKTDAIHSIFMKQIMLNVADQW